METPLKLLCPKSKEPVIEHDTWYEFKGYRGLYANKEWAKRKMKPEEYAAALAGEKKVLQGFVSRAGNKFAAFIVFDPENNRFKWEFPERPQPKVTDLRCPRSGEPVIEYPERYVFPGFKREDGKFVWFSTELCGRKMKAEDYIEIFTKSSVQAPVMFDGLISKKTNKPFSTGLVYDDKEQKIVMVFPDRGTRDTGSPHKNASPATASHPDLEEAPAPAGMSGNGFLPSEES